jgi:hypothetical protein
MPARSIDVAAILTFLVIVTTALVYTAGWSYAHNYFFNYRVGLLSLEIPREYYLMYGYWVIEHYWWLIPILFLFSIVIHVVLASWPLNYTRLAKPVAMWIFPLLILLLFLGSYKIGALTAHSVYLEDKQTNYEAYPSVRVWIDPSWEKDIGVASLRTNLAEGCYRLLMQRPGTLYLFRPVKGALIADLPQLRVPVSQIRALRILTGVKSCP